MKFINRLFVAAGLAAYCFVASAAEPTPDAPTLMSERGKLLFSDKFDQPLGNEWKTAKGKWEVVEGAIRGAELKADMHGAVTRHTMPFQNAVIQYSFKLEGTKQTTLSINDSTGHLCRVLINETGFTVQKDDHDHTGPDVRAVLDTNKTPIKAGVWHTVVMEMVGTEMLARIDGKEVAFGAHDVIAGSKANFGLTVAGESASFKDFRVWEALPNKTWAASKAELLKSRAK